MSKIGEQLQDLRASIDNIKENMKKIKIEKGNKKIAFIKITIKNFTIST